MRQTVKRLLLALLPLIATAAAAETFPTKPITIVVPYQPGGATDIVARVVAEQMHESLGQNVIVENKPGAFGMLAIQELARSRPDGYTLMIGNVSTGAITPVLFADRMQVDYAKTVIPVTKLGELPGFFAGTSVNFAPRTLAEFVDYAKAHDNAVRYGSAGLGSYPQFDMELFAQRAGIHLVHVPAKGGGADIVNAMATGDIQAAFINVASSAGMIKAGRIIPYALVSDARLPDYPAVPTMAELGYGGIGTLQWQALFARAGTPQPVLDTIFREAVKAVNSERAKQVFVPANLIVRTSASPADAAAWMQTEMAHWQQVVAQTHIHMD